MALFEGYSIYGKMEQSRLVTGNGVRSSGSLGSSSSKSSKKLSYLLSIFFACSVFPESSSDKAML
jgi:hypothetical protein